MNRYIQAAKTYLATHKKELNIAAFAAVGVAVLASLVALFIYSNDHKYTYQPVKACDLFTPAEATDLLGEKVIGINAKEPVVSGHRATSKCSYTDSNPDSTKMIVAAIAVRSAIDDTGIAENRSDFALAKKNNTVEDVPGLGDSAYFNKTAGQLNVLDGRKWIILNYGIGSAPETNTIEKAIELARKVLR